MKVGQLLGRKAKGLTALLALLLALFVVACGGDDSADTTVTDEPAAAETTEASGEGEWAGGDEYATELESLHQAALDAGEGQVVLYGPYAEAFMPIWEKFSDRFPGLKVTPRTLTGGGGVAALQAEVASGKQVGDVIMQGLESVVLPADEDLLEAYRPPTAALLDARFIDAEDRFIAQFGDIYGAMYNTDKLSEDQVPETLEDLTGADAKGGVIDNPVLGLVSGFALMPPFYGDPEVLNTEMMESLKANLNVVEDTGPFYTEVTTGQTALIPWAGHSYYLGMKAGGAPIAFKASPGLSPVVLGATGIITGAPHLNAAKLFQAWFLTPEAQQAIVDDGGSIALLEGIEYPAEWPELQPLIDGMPDVPLAEYHEAMDAFREHVKPVFE